MTGKVRTCCKPRERETRKRKGWRRPPHPPPPHPPAPPLWALQPSLLKPLQAGYLSYYVITLAGTPNESCGNLSALWIAPSPSTIYQLAPHLTQSTRTHPPHTHTHTPTHSLIRAGVDRLGDMDQPCNGIPMLNTRPVFFVIWGDHALSQIA